MGPGGRPVYTPHDKRAIQTGRREPNPARTRYPVYSRDDLAALAFPPSAWADKNNRHKLRERALKAACEIKALGGCVIDSERGLWRIMPRDFNADGPDIPACPKAKVENGIGCPVSRDWVSGNGPDSATNSRRPYFPLLCPSRDRGG